jgi:hypothetical protein
METSMNNRQNQLVQSKQFRGEFKSVVLWNEYVTKLDRFDLYE